MEIQLDTVDSSLGCVFIKRLDFGLGSSVIWIGGSGVDSGLINMCPTGLVKTSGLDMYTVGLLPRYMYLVIDLYRSESRWWSWLMILMLFDSDDMIRCRWLFMLGLWYIGD